MKINRAVFAMILIVSIFVFLGCSDTDREKIDVQNVKIATKNTQEQIILANLAAILINEKTDHNATIEKRENVTSASLYNDLERNKINVYFDYTGSIYLNGLGLPKDEMPNAILLTQLQKTLFENNIFLSKSIGYDGGLTLFMTPELREELNMPQNISDLKKLSPKLRIGMEESFYNRSTGYESLVKTYELNFEKSKVYTEEEGFFALRRGDIDVMVGSRTSVYNNMYNLYLFNDDKRFFVPETSCFVANNELLVDYPEIESALSTFDNLITSGTMSTIIRKVYVEGVDLDTYLHAFLRARNLL